MKLNYCLMILCLCLTSPTSSHAYSEQTSTNLSHFQEEQIQYKQDEQILIERKLFEDCITAMPSAWTGHRSFAHWLVNYLQPNQIVDLGIDFGYSTFIFANAARENGGGIVTGIDWFQGDAQTGSRNTYDAVLKMVEKLNFHNLEIIKGDFTEVSQTWDRAIDILHIDGFHSYEAVSNDYKTWSPFLSDNGIILFHDINVPSPRFEVIKLFRELDDGYKLYFLHSYGLGIFTRNGELYEEIKAQFANVYDYSTTPL